MALIDVPLPGQTLAASRPSVQSNFAAIRAGFVVDHVDYAIANQGKHNQITLPIQDADPATAAGDMALYSLVSAITGIQELSVRRPAAGDIYEFTASGLTWTRLPSGILLKWGGGVANGLTTVTFPVAANIPAFTTIYALQVCTAYVSVADGDGFVRLNDVGAPWTQFTVYASQRTAVATRAVNFQFLALGR